MLACLLLNGFLAMADEPSPLPTSPGVHSVERTVEGKLVRFTFVLPEGTKPGGGADVPVVLALHYAGHGTPHYARPFVEQLVVPGLSKLGAIVVAPDCPGQSWTQAAVQTTVLTLLDEIVAETHGDPKRVVVTGYSMGGMGSWSFALRHPERFVAAIPVAGRPRRAEDVRIPVYAIHGAADELIGPGPTEAGVAAMKRAGVESRFVSLPGRTHYEVPSYAPALAEAVPWIEARWRATAD